MFYRGFTEICKLCFIEVLLKYVNCVFIEVLLKYVNCVFIEVLLKYVNCVLSRFYCSM